MGKKILVTGATGFLGSHLCPSLSRRGDEVFALFRTLHRQGLLRSDHTTILGDVTDQKFVQRVLAEYGIDCVVHLAAQAQVSVGQTNPESMIRENIMGGLAVLEAARQAKTPRVIIASTDKVYGELDRDKIFYTEDTTLGERSPYGASKACLDILAQTYQKSYGMSIAITRCGNLYGPGHLNWSTLIPGTIRRLSRGESPVLKFGGEAVRDFLYVNDAVEAYLALIDSSHCGPFNFSGGQPRTILHIVKMIGNIMGTSVPIRFEVDGTGEIMNQALSSDHAGELLGWKPKIQLEEGLKETIKWYTSYLKTGSLLLDSCWFGTKTGSLGVPFEQP